MVTTTTWDARFAGARLALRVAIDDKRFIVVRKKHSGKCVIKIAPNILAR